MHTASAAQERGGSAAARHAQRDGACRAAPHQRGPVLELLQADVAPQVRAEVLHDEGLPAAQHGAHEVLVDAHERRLRAQAGEFRVTKLRVSPNPLRMTPNAH